MLSFEKNYPPPPLSSFVTLMFCCLLSIGFAQDTTFLHKDSIKLFKADPNELLKLIRQKEEEEEKVSVASFKETSLRESPGIISVITEEEIRNSGARDLIDILRLIPGLHFAHNYENAIGLAVRGNWAEEGKFLLLIDGNIFNENSFGTVVFGMRIPISQIKRIEIIRGAGSAIYGGLAELCVINVITQSPNVKSFVDAQANVGFSEGRSSRSGIYADLFQAYQGNTDLNLSVASQKGNRSNSTFTDSQGRLINYGDSTGTNTTFINMSLNHRNFHTKFVYSNYEYENLNRLPINFRDYIVSAFYDWQISKKLVIRPKATYRALQSWWYQDYQDLPAVNVAVYDGYRTLNKRYTGSLTANYSFSENVNIALGTELFSESARYPNQLVTFPGNIRKKTFNNIAAFGEVSINSKIANFTAGVRYDDNSAVEPALVPRVAVTKAMKKWHIKALYSSSFKAPTIQNITFSIDENIRPERTTMLEMELGYKFSEKVSINANVFDINIKKPIVYFIDRATFDEGYANLEQTGSRGVEVELKSKMNWMYFNVNYSYYLPNYNQTPNYQVVPTTGELDNTRYLGISNHKITLNSCLHLPEKRWKLNTTFMYFSDKYTYLFYTNTPDLVLTAFRPELHFNMAFHYKITDEFNLMLAAYNILRQNLWFINPYNSGDNPVPEQRQEFSLRLSYKINAK
jgi:outer membrane cobalamin receptor